MWQEKLLAKSAWNGKIGLIHMFQIHPFPTP